MDAGKIYTSTRQLEILISSRKTNKFIQLNQPV